MEGLTEKSPIVDLQNVLEKKNKQLTERQKNIFNWLIETGQMNVLKNALETSASPQFRNPTKSLRALCPKTAKNEIFLVRTDFLPRVGRYASIMPPYPHLGLQTTAPPKRLAHP